MCCTGRWCCDRVPRKSCNSDLGQGIFVITSKCFCNIDISRKLTARLLHIEEPFLLFYGYSGDWECNYHTALVLRSLGFETVSFSVRQDKRTQSCAVFLSFCFSLKWKVYVYDIACPFFSVVFVTDSVVKWKKRGNVVQRFKQKIWETRHTWVDNLEMCVFQIEM